jgi:hypothetical protein
VQAEGFGLVSGYRSKDVDRTRMESTLYSTVSIQGKYHSRFRNRQLTSIASDKAPKLTTDAANKAAQVDNSSPFFNWWYKRSKATGAGQVHIGYK